MRKPVIAFTYDDIASERKHLNDSSADRVMAMNDLTASIKHAKRTLSELIHRHDHSPQRSGIQLNGSGPDGCCEVASTITVPPPYFPASASFL